MLVERRFELSSESTLSLPVALVPLDVVVSRPLFVIADITTTICQSSSQVSIMCLLVLLAAGLEVNGSQALRPRKWRF